jgi:TonB family protein
VSFLQRLKSGQGDPHAPSALDEQHSDQAPAFFGVAMIERALAEAGHGREDGAICRYQAAQALEPRLYGADLSAFGAAGALLMSHLWGEESGDIRGAAQRLRFPTTDEVAVRDSAVTRPEIVSRRNPEFPEYARHTLVGGTVILESVITEGGTPRSPNLLRRGATLGYDASALDAVCDWRFRPATWKGQPIKVYYTLTVNFEIRPR